MTVNLVYKGSLGHSEIEINRSKDSIQILLIHAGKNYRFENKSKNIEKLILQLFLLIHEKGHDKFCTFDFSGGPKINLPLKSTKIVNIWEIYDSKFSKEKNHQFVRPLDVNAVASKIFGNSMATNIPLQRRVCSEKLLPSEQIQPIIFEKEENYKNHLWTFDKFQEQHLYGKGGFYQEQVQFSNLDFNTYATTNNKLAVAILSQAIHIWGAMVRAGDLEFDERFDVIEMAGGNGMMAYHFLTFAETHLSQSQDKFLKQFWNNLSYTSLDISHDLIRRQNIQNSKFLELKKYQTLLCDSRKIDKQFQGSQFKGLFFSNEMIDNFPVKIFKKEGGDRLLVLYLIPALKKDQLSSDLAEMLIEELNLPPSAKAQLSASHEFYQFFSVKKLTLIPDALKKDLAFFKIWLPTSSLETELNGELAPDIKSVPVFSEFHITLGCTSFLKGVSEILNKGCLLTIDYGGANEGALTSPLRTYGNQQLLQMTPTAIYNFQKYDITKDVNFTQLDKLGKNFGFKSYAYARQMYLNSVTPSFTHSQIYVTPVSEKNTFRFLMQKKKGTAANLCFFGISSCLDKTSNSINQNNLAKVIGSLMADIYHRYGQERTELFFPRLWCSLANAKLQKHTQTKIIALTQNIFRAFRKEEIKLNDFEQKVFQNFIQNTQQSS